MIPMSALNRARRALADALVASAHRAARDHRRHARRPPRRRRPSRSRAAARRASSSSAARSSRPTRPLDAGADGVVLDFLELTGTGAALRALRARAGPVARHRSPRPASASPARRRSTATSAILAPDALLVRSLGALHDAARTAIPRIGDFSLNVTNRLTAARVLARGLVGLHAVVRPRRGAARRPLRHARSAPWAEVVVHHPMPLFHMEHCVIAALLSRRARPPRLRPPVREAPRSACATAPAWITRSRPTSAAATPCSTRRRRARPASSPSLQKSGVRRFRIELVRESADDVGAHRRRLPRAARRAVERAPSVWKTLEDRGRLRRRDREPPRARSLKDDVVMDNWHVGRPLARRSRPGPPSAPSVRRPTPSTRRAPSPPIARALRDIPFYQKRGHVPPAPGTPLRDALARLPLLHKKDVRADAAEAVGARRARREGGARRRASSSSSRRAGRPASACASSGTRAGGTARRRGRCARTRSSPARIDGERGDVPRGRPHDARVRPRHLPHRRPALRGARRRVPRSSSTSARTRSSGPTTSRRGCSTSSRSHATVGLESDSALPRRCWRASRRTTGARSTSAASSSSPTRSRRARYLRAIREAFAGPVLQLYGASEVGVLFMEGDDGRLHHAPVHDARGAPARAGADAGREGRRARRRDDARPRRACRSCASSSATSCRSTRPARGASRPCRRSRASRGASTTRSCGPTARS